MTSTAGPESDWAILFHLLKASPVPCTCPVLLTSHLTGLPLCGNWPAFNFMCHTLRFSAICSGSSTSSTKASVNAPSNQQHHPSYDNAAYAGSDIFTACHPPSLYEESDSIKHDLHSAGLNTINAAQMVYDRPQWKTFVCGLPTLEPEHGP